VLACGEQEDGPKELEVLVDVTNIGTCPGKETVQFYIEPVTKPRLARPPRELKGWDKVLVQPGQTVTACAKLDRGSISYWDDAPQAWVIEAGAEFRVVAARHSRDTKGVAAAFRSKGAVQWIH